MNSRDQIFNYQKDTIRKECLRHTHDNPADAKNLRAMLSISGGRLRKIVNSLRCEGYPILSKNVIGGYWFARSNEEIKLWLMKNRKRIIIQLAAHSGVKKNVSRFVPPVQTELL
jgi:biotin operon repressor